MRTRKLMLLCVEVLLTAGLTTAIVQARQESNRKFQVPLLLLPEPIKMQEK